MTEAASSTLTSDNANVLRGRLLVLLSGAGMSLGGLFIRSIQDANEWQILFWRSLGIIAVLLVFIAFRSQGRIFQAFRAAGAKGERAKQEKHTVFIGQGGEEIKQHF